MFHFPKMSQREQYTKQKLYEEAFNVSFNWEKYLSQNVSNSMISHAGKLILQFLYKWE